MLLTRAGRRRDIDQQLSVWEPLVGREAATTALRGRWWGQGGFLLLLLWVGLYITLDATNAAGGDSGRSRSRTLAVDPDRPRRRSPPQHPRLAASGSRGWHVP